MKQFVFVFCALLFAGCAETIDFDTEKEEVQAVLDRYVAAVEALDPELYLKDYAQDDDLVIYHAIPNVRYVGYETLKEAIEESLTGIERAKVTYDDVAIKIDSSGSVAWLTGYMDMTIAEPEQEPVQYSVRITMILENREGAWLVVHAHASPR